MQTPNQPDSEQNQASYLNGDDFGDRGEGYSTCKIKLEGDCNREIVSENGRTRSLHLASWLAGHHPTARIAAKIRHHIACGTDDFRGLSGISEEEGQVKGYLRLESL